jgi:anti-anti-sigma factor
MTCTPESTRLGSVALELRAAGVAIVAIVGEHDLATRALVVEALQEATARRRHVLVDLADCTFVDHGTVAAILAAHEEVSASGDAVAVVLPAGATAVSRTVDAMGLAEALPIHATADDALRALAHAARVHDRRVHPGDRDTFQAACSCGWTGAVHTGVLALHRARDEATAHADSPPARG